MFYFHFAVTTTTTTTMPTPPMPNCQDNNRYCSYWASRGECTRNPSYMNRNCQRACNRCDNEESDCRDMNSNCPNWTSFCNNDIYRDYLANNCALSCGVCTANDVSGFSIGSCCNSRMIFTHMPGYAGLVSIWRDNEYPTMQYFGIPRHTQSMIA